MFFSSFIVAAVFVTVVGIAPGILLNDVVAPGLVVFGLLQWLHMLGEKGMREVLPPLAPSHTKERRTGREVRHIMKATTPRTVKDPSPSSRALVVYCRDTVLEQSSMAYRLPLSRNCLPIQHRHLLAALLSAVIRSAGRNLLLNWDFNTVFRPFVVYPYYSKVWWALQFEESMVETSLKKPPPPEKTVDSRGLITFPEYQTPLPEDILNALCDVFNHRLVFEDGTSVSAVKSYREYTATVTNYSYTGSRALVRKGEQCFVLLRAHKILGVPIVTAFCWSSLTGSDVRDARLANGIVGLGIYKANISISRLLRSVLRDDTQQGNAHTGNAFHVPIIPAQPSQTPNLIISRDNGTATKRLGSSDNEVYSPNKRIKLMYPDGDIHARPVSLEKHVWFGALLQSFVSEGVKKASELPAVPSLNTAVQPQGQLQVQNKRTSPARSPKRKFDDGHCIQVQAQPLQRAVKRLRYDRSA